MKHCFIYNEISPIKIGLEKYLVFPNRSMKVKSWDESDMFRIIVVFANKKFPTKFFMAWIERWGTENKIFRFDCATGIDVGEALIF